MIRGCVMPKEGSKPKVKKGGNPSGVGSVGIGSKELMSKGGFTSPKAKG